MREMFCFPNVSTMVYLIEQLEWGSGDKTYFYIEVEQRPLVFLSAGYKELVYPVDLLSVSAWWRPCVLETSSFQNQELLIQCDDMYFFLYHYMQITCTWCTTGQMYTQLRCYAENWTRTKLIKWGAAGKRTVNTSLIYIFNGLLDTGQTPSHNQDLKRFISIEFRTTEYVKEKKKRKPTAKVKFLSQIFFP